MVYNCGTVLRVQLFSELCLSVFVFGCDAAWNHCRRVVVADAAHLKGSWNGRIYSVNNLDANNHVLPLAFGVGQGDETSKNSGLALECLVQYAFALIFCCFFRLRTMYCRRDVGLRDARILQRREFGHRRPANFRQRWRIAEHYGGANVQRPRLLPRDVSAAFGSRSAEENESVIQER